MMNLEELNTKIEIARMRIAEIDRNIKNSQNEMNATLARIAKLDEFLEDIK